MRRGGDTAPYLTAPDREMVDVLATAARNRFLRCTDFGFQRARPFWIGLEFDDVSTAGCAKWRVVAACDASVCASHVVSFVVGWDCVSKSLLQPG